MGKTCPKKSPGLSLDFTIDHLSPDLVSKLYLPAVFIFPITIITVYFPGIVDRAHLNVKHVINFVLDKASLENW